MSVSMKNKKTSASLKREDLFVAPSSMESLLAKNSNIPPRRFIYGELTEGTVVAKGRNELLLDVGGKSEGIIYGKGIPDDRDTFGKSKIGDKVLATITQTENDQGYLVLSLSRAVPSRRWRELADLFASDGTLDVKVLDYHKGGLLVDAIPQCEDFYLRGFIPLSHLDPSKVPARLTNVARGSAVNLKDQLAPLMGQIRKVKVIEIDRARNRLVFSEKNAIEDTFKDVREQVMADLTTGQVFDATVTGVMPFGYFARLHDSKGEYLGLDGLIHISEVTWEKVDNPLQVYQVGSQVKVVILEKSTSGNKLALSVKKAMSDPWKDIDQKYALGALVRGKVTKIVDFGAFVNLDSGIDGLIHVSETTGPLAVGDDVTAKVINLDPISRRLGLSVKALTAGSNELAKETLGQEE